MDEMVDAVPAPCGGGESTLHLLLVASEIVPLAKTGGLADVCGALPAAVARLGIDVRLIMPAYPEALACLDAPRQAADLGELLPGATVRLIAGSMPDSGLPVWLIDCPALYDRTGTPYQDSSGCEWGDNAQRFGVLCHAAARAALGQAVHGS
ncbi:glycogen/starch synthase [Cupriavidus oxalaticus]|nr:glycogen/starch synthase [Cupriavidus oxalaticus]